jgi:hypothetical protein
MDDVHGTIGEPADQDGAIDRLLFGPVRTGGRKIGRRRATLGDRLVLEVAEDVAVLAVQLAEAAERSQALHRLGDELVGDHPLRALLVRHEQLERRDAHPHRLWDAVDDVWLVVQDEVKAEVEDGQRARLLAKARDGFWQGLAVVVHDERQECRESRARGGKRRRLPVVVLGADVEVTVDEAGQHVLARGVDHAIRRWQQGLGPERDDLVALDRHCGIEDVRRGNDLAAADDGVD